MKNFFIKILYSFHSVPGWTRSVLPFGRWSWCWAWFREVSSSTTTRQVWTLTKFYSLCFLALFHGTSITPRQLLPELQRYKTHCRWQWCCTNSGGSRTLDCEKYREWYNSVSEATWNTTEFLNATVQTTLDGSVPLSEVFFPSVVVCNINQVLHNQPALLYSFFAYLYLTQKKINQRLYNLPAVGLLSKSW